MPTTEPDLAEILARNPAVKLKPEYRLSAPRQQRQREMATSPRLEGIACPEPQQDVKGAGSSGRPRRKYRNEPVTVDGIRFDSKKEATRFGELSVVQGAGVIFDLECHPQYVFEHNGMRIGSFRPDFRYYDSNGQCVIEDVKSPSTRKETSYRLRKRMMKVFFGLEVIEI